MTQLRDKGQSPRRSLPEITPQQLLGTSFKDFINLETSTIPSKTGYLGHNDSLCPDEKITNLLDTSLTWPSPDSSFLVSGSPITVGSPGALLEQDSNIRDGSLSPKIPKGQRDMTSRADVRSQSPSQSSPTRRRSARSLSSHARERSWSPPSFRDKSLSLQKPSDPQYRLIDSLSLPESQLKMGSKYKDKGDNPRSYVSRFLKPSSTIPITVTPASTLTDTSSSITSTLTSAPTSSREPLVQTSEPYRFPRGLSPPVRDSGSSLTTVTTLTDQQASESARGSGADSARDRRPSFDLGFLDVLTVDSNSSVVDQLSTGRVSASVVSCSESFSVVTAECER